MRADDFLLLTSSNATKKYFSNAISALCWPRDWVSHVRYQVRLVDDGLIREIPRKDASNGAKSALVGRRVLVAFMFQTRVMNPTTHALDWQQEALYPFRYGKLVEAYRIGSGDHDIVHFYFGVEGCHVPTPDAPLPIEPAKLLKPNIHAAAVPIKASESAPQKDESAAYDLLESVHPEHLTFQPDQADLSHKALYYPVLCRIRDLRSVGGKYRVRKPKFGARSRTSFYELTERKAYLFDFGFYVPRASGSPSSGSKVALTHDSKTFLTAPKRSLSVESRYDEQAWLVVPGITEGTIYRELTLSTRVKAPQGTNAQPADLSLTLPVTIKQNRWVRWRYGVGGFIAAAALALGTLALAFIAKPPYGLSVEALAVAAALGYLVWLVLNAFSGGSKPYK